MLERLLCITDHILPMEAQHWVSPAYLARLVEGEPSNCEPDQTVAVQWFEVPDVPANLTLTARTALQAYSAAADESKTRSQ
jgi:8-oxo-dGTP diphosphatase